MESTPEVAGEQTSIFENKLEPIYTQPERIIISKLNIDKQLVDLGVNEVGVMETPKNFMDLGYYVKSAKVGQKGNLIIAGHYDDTSARPAAFWLLKNLIEGDRVVVVDKYKRTYTYVVTDSFLVDIDDPNRLQVIEKDSDSSELTLITCGGVWDYTSGTYSKRQVVKAKLVE